MSEGCGRCFKCREGTGCIRAVSFSATAMPNRFPEVDSTVQMESRWDKDMKAYKNLRHNGLQPPRIDDCAQLETRANDQVEVEIAKIVPKRVMPQVKEGMALSRAMEEAGSMKPKVIRSEA